MVEQPAPDSRPPAVSALEEMYALVQQNPMQPLIQIAEGEVMHWLRVVEGKENVQPRFTPGSVPSTAFYRGLDSGGQQQLDSAAAGSRPEEFEDQFPARLAQLAERVDAYFGGDGYRASSEQCDRAMVELERLSRFLSAWCLRIEELGYDAPAAPAVASHRPGARGFSAYAPPSAPAALVRWHQFFWEPHLNTAIVAWAENTLQPFDEALKYLKVLLELSGRERAGHFMGSGYPLRTWGRPRMKVAVFSPVQRPLRTRSVFEARYRQLLRRIEEAGDSPGRAERGLLEDIRHFIAMIRDNVYMLANQPGFLNQARPGLPVIRGLPTTHPFLLDPAEFFKKAILFDNGTYTVAGGGVDAMYLQVRQLERYYRFHPGAQARRILGTIQDCAIAWEENRCDGFTAKLLEIAARLRRETGPLPAEP